MLALRRSIIAFLFLLAIALSGWSMLISKQTAAPLAPQQAEKADLVMENVTATIINKQGKPSLKIETIKMVHFAEGDVTQLTTPHITVFRQSPNPWYIDSDYAKTTHGTTQIDLWSHVVIHHPEDKINPKTTMETASLTIFPEKQIAKTNEAVVLTQPDTTIHAIGMLANLDDGTVKLISQARTEYVPSL